MFIRFYKAIWFSYKDDREVNVVFLLFSLVCCLSMQSVDFSPALYITKGLYQTKNKKKSHLCKQIFKIESIYVFGCIKGAFASTV